MVTCNDCIHRCVCPIADGCEYADEQHIRDDCEYFAHSADVVPKSEVVKVLDEIEKTIRGALVLICFSYKHNQKEIQCKKECYEDFLGYVAELKKKYTEGKDD
jgi:hypothetical protein